MTTWLVIVAMAAVTYATRVTMLLALRGKIAPWLKRWLAYVPLAVFTALIVPGVLLQSHGDTMRLAPGPALPAGLVGAVVAWRTGNVLLTIAAGLITFWLIRRL